MEFIELSETQNALQFIFKHANTHLQINGI